MILEIISEDNNSIDLANFISGKINLSYFKFVQSNSVNVEKQVCYLSKADLTELIEQLNNFSGLKLNTSSLSEKEKINYRLDIDC